MKRILLLSLIALSTMVWSSCDDCRNVECENDGTCEEGTCECPEGFSGSTCQVEDLCLTQEVECKNDGECLDGSCNCRGGYYGETCEVLCLYGTYENGDCACNQGIDGESCDVFSRERYLGVYTLESNGSIESCVISKGDYENGDAWKMEMSNISTYNDTDGYGEVDGLTITIPEQTVTGSGSIKYDLKTVTPGTFEDDGSEITFTIEITRISSLEGAVEESDTYVFSRQSLQ